MLWFNEEKDLGVLTAATGERLSVSGSDFAGGERPHGRVAGKMVEFRIAGDGDSRRAEHVALVEDEAPRRARRRSR